MTNKRSRLLLVEDEPSLVRTLGDLFQSEGYDVETSGNGKDALERASTAAYDLLILDVMLPGLDGFQVARRLRKLEVETPILMLTARSETSNKIAGFRLGVDDYMTKPFDTEELLLRTAALLRRTARRDSPMTSYTHSTFKVDFEKLMITRESQMLPLSAREAQVLRYLIEHKGEVVARDELLRKVWGYLSTQTRTVDVHIAWLRQKVERDPHSPEHIITVHGQGYRFDD